MMNGVDDYPKRTEVTDLGDAQQLLNFAKANGMSALSIWAIQRDNGTAPVAGPRTTAPASPRAPGTSATCSRRSPPESGLDTVYAGNGHRVLARSRR